MINLVQTSYERLNNLILIDKQSEFHSLLDQHLHAYFTNQLPLIVSHLGDQITATGADELLNFEPSKIKKSYTKLHFPAKNFEKEFSGNVILILSELNFLQRTSFLSLDKKTMYTLKFKPDNIGSICLNSVEIGTFNTLDNRILTLPKRLFFLSKEIIEKIKNYIPL